MAPSGLNFLFQTSELIILGVSQKWVHFLSADTVLYANISKFCAMDYNECEIKINEE